MKIQLLYDHRSVSFKETVDPIKALILWKTKDKMLCWVFRNNQSLNGLVVIPRCIYFYYAYIPSGVIDAIKYFLK